MPRDLEPSLAESKFLLESLKEGIRLDSRPADAFRDLQINFGKEYGLVELALGHTRIVSRISASIVVPLEDRPFDGQFLVNTELSSMASTQFEGNRATDTELLISRILEKAIRRARALDTETLCIVSQKQCWQIRADVHFLNHDGNLLDAACIALMASLLHFRRPDVVVSGEKITVYPISERVPVPLQINHVPICITFSFYNNGTISLLDVTKSEEVLRDGEMTITLNKHKEMCQINKAGGIAIDANILMKCSRIAYSKTLELSKILEDAVKADLLSKEEVYNGGRADNDRVQDRPIG